MQPSPIITVNPATAKLAWKPYLSAIRHMKRPDAKPSEPNRLNPLIQSSILVLILAGLIVFAEKLIDASASWQKHLGYRRQY